MDIFVKDDLIESMSLACRKIDGWLQINYEPAEIEEPPSPEISTVIGRIMRITKQNGIFQVGHYAIFDGPTVIEASGLILCYHGEIRESDGKLLRITEIALSPGLGRYVRQDKPIYAEGVRDSDMASTQAFLDTTIDGFIRFANNPSRPYQGIRREIEAAPIVSSSKAYV